MTSYLNNQLESSSESILPSSISCREVKHGHLDSMFLLSGLRTLCGQQMTDKEKKKTDKVIDLKNWYS